MSDIVASCHSIAHWLKTVVFSPETHFKPSKVERGVNSLWETLPPELQIKILQTARAEGTAPLKAIRLQCRLLNQVATPVLFDCLRIRSQRDLDDWLLRVEEEIAKGKSAIPWLEEIRILEFEHPKYLKEDKLRRLFSLAERFMKIQVLDLYVVSGNFYDDRTDCLWLADILRDKGVPRLVFHNPTLPAHILGFLNFPASSAFDIVDCTHFYLPHIQFDDRPRLSANMRLYSPASNLYGWQRVEQLEFWEFNEETVGLLRECTNVNTLTAYWDPRFVADPPIFRPFQDPLPNISNICSLVLTCEERQISEVVDVVLVNIPHAARLTALHLTIILKNVNVWFVPINLHKLIDGVDILKPDLEFVRIQIKLDVPLSDIHSDQDDRWVPDILTIWTYLSELRADHHFLDTAFMYLDNEDISLGDLNNLLQPKWRFIRRWWDSAIAAIGRLGALVGGGNRRNDNEGWAVTSWTQDGWTQDGWTQDGWTQDAAASNHPWAAASNSPTNSWAAASNSPTNSWAAVEDTQVGRHVKRREMINYILAFLGGAALTFLLKTCAIRGSVTGQQQLQSP